MTDRKPRRLPETLQEALYELVHHSDGFPMKAQAEFIEKATTTLNNAAGGVEGARFDALWLLKLTGRARNFVAMDFMEAQLGRVAVTVDVTVPAGATLQAGALRVVKELGDACGEITKALDPKRPRGSAISGDEKARIKKETYELLQEAARLWKLAEGL